MSERAYDLKSALPNKVLDEDGNTTDLFGNPVTPTSEAYRNKPSLPNKWLNPDGTYSTLTELIAGAIDTDLFVIVEELPEEGDPKKIYLVPDGQGGFIEYHYVDGDWDPIGIISIDLSDYWTIEQVQQAIADALQTSKDYADAGDTATLGSAEAYTDNAIASFVPLRAFPVSVITDQSTTAFFNSIKALNLPTGSMMLGLVELTDMPTGLIQAEVRIEIYENNVVYGIMRSADLEPYVWEANSYDYRGWEQEGQTILDQAKDYTDAQIAGISGLDPQVFYWDGNTQQSGLAFWNRIYQLQKTQPCIVIHTLQVFQASAQYKTFVWHYNNNLPTSGGTTLSSNIESWSFNAYGQSGSFNTFKIIRASLYFTIENDEVTRIFFNTETNDVNYLDTMRNLNTSYVPLYPSSPASKKYVDDSIANSITNAIGGAY